MSPDIRVRSGVLFNFIFPAADTILIEDIAFALSHVNRFTGHVGAYSVAQHSVLVSQQVPAGYALAALLHDASEAYLGDVSRPLKQLLPEYKRIERRVHRAIYRRFCLAPLLPDCVHEADYRVYLSETRDLRKEGIDQFDRGLEPYPAQIVPWPAALAEQLFLRRFHNLGGAYNSEKVLDTEEPPVV